MSYREPGITSSEGYKNERKCKGESGGERKRECNETDRQKAK